MAENPGGPDGNDPSGGDSFSAPTDGSFMSDAAHPDDHDLSQDAISMDKFRALKGLPPLPTEPVVQPTQIPGPESWYQQTAESTHAPVSTDEQGLASPYRPPEAYITPGSTTMDSEPLEGHLDAPAISREHLNALRAELHKSPEVVDERLDSGLKVVNELFANGTARAWYDKHPYNPRAEGEEGAGGVEKYKTALNEAVNAAKRGELGSVKLLWGQASGDVTFPDNARDMIETIGGRLLQRSSFHNLTDIGRNRLAETIKLESTADKAVTDETLLRAMAIGHDHTVAIESPDGHSKDYLSPVLTDQNMPTGMWLKVGSSAFTEQKYNPNQGYIWGVELLVPPHGETPAFTDAMREKGMRPLMEKRDAFKRYMDTSTTTVMPPGLEPMAEYEFGRRVETDPTMQLHGGKEVTVSSHTLIDAGEQEFVLDWSPDNTSATLTNEKLRRHLWRELKNTNLELPYEEQKDITAQIAQMTAELTSVQLQVGKPVIIGRDVEGPRLKTDDTLSRQHFSVELQPDGTVKIVDLNSSNGTAITNKELNEEQKKTSNLITSVPSFPATPAPEIIPPAQSSEPQRKGFFRRKK